MDTTTFFSFPFFFTSLVIGHQTSTSSSASTMTCSVRRYGELTPFNPDQSGRFVEIPCAYRITDMRCGDYSFDVIGTNVGDGPDNSRFSPFVLHVSFLKAGNPFPYWRGEVHRDWITNRAHGNIPITYLHYDNLWYLQPGSVFDENIISVFDAAEPSVTVKIEDVAEVEFSASPDDTKNGIHVRCHDLRSSTPFWNSLCGDAKGSVDFRKLTEEKNFLNESQLFTWAILYQNIGHPCYDMANYYKACASQTRATRTCAPMFNEEVLAKCYTGNHPWPNPHGSYEWFEKCLQAVCDNNGTRCNELKAKAESCQLKIKRKTRVLRRFRKLLHSCPSQ